VQIKAILDEVLRESGFTAPSAYATSNNDADKQAFALANRALRTLTTDSWRSLYRAHTFTMTSATAYDLPVDYREIVPDTMWNTNSNLKVIIPPSDEVWAYLQANDVATGVQEIARITEGQLHIENPTPGSGIRFEYITNHPVTANDTTTKARFTADNDTCLLDDDLLIMDIKWRWNKLKGLPWEADLQEAKIYQKSVRAADRPPKKLNMTGNMLPPLNEPYTDTWK